MDTFFTQYKTFWYLMQRSFLIYKERFIGQLLNALCWSCLGVGVFAYIMPKMGLQDLGFFMLIGNVVSVLFFTSLNAVVVFLFEVNGDSSNLSYELTLPINQTLIFVKHALVNALQSLILALIMFPIGMFVIWPMCDFTYFDSLKFFLFLILLALFFGIFFLFCTVITKDLDDWDGIFCRFVWPLWMMGGFQFSWYKLHAVSPILAYINLANPMVYAFEGLRSVSMDPSLSLPFWINCSAIIFFTVIVGCASIKMLKKRLDCL